MASSLSISKIFDVVKEVRGDHELPRLCVIGAGAEHARVAEALAAGTHLLPGGASSVMETLRLGDVSPQVRSFDPYDIAVFVAAGTNPTEVAPYVKAARNGGRQVIALVDGDDADAWARTAGVAHGEVARGLARESKARPSLEQQIIRAADSAAGTLAAHLPAVRRVYAEHVILKNAKQNGIIGVVVIIPGADMPAMTANQIRMVLQIARAYGEEIGLDRALEILSVVGSAFVFRSLARQSLAFVPGLGWVLKGAIGFAATMALGRAAISYFEAGAPIQVSHMKRVEHQVERVRNKLPGSIRHFMGGR